MATRLESATVYAAGAVQGIVLVTFPAASTVFTSPAEYGLSSTQYGSLFLPQVALAITASLLGAALGRRVGQKPLYLGGLAASLVAMVLLLVSTAYTHDQSVSVPLLLVATAFVGLGFGLTVPALNSLTAAFHPGRVDGSILTLNAVLGVGTVLAPLFVALFVGLGFWWGLPVTSLVLLGALLAVSLRLPLRVPGTPATRVSPGRAGSLPARFWWYAAFAVLYGIAETVNGNWAQLDLTTTHGASTQQAALALTLFWAMVTAGRILFAAVHRISPTWTYRLLPFALAAVFLLISALPAGATWAAVAAFGLAGLGCSALLPLTISFGQEELTRYAAAIAGGVIAFYQLGYGIAAFGVGPLLDRGVGLPQIYRWAALAAIAMGLLAFVVRRGAPQPRPAAVRTTAVKG
ncbi:MAG: MFS transporter [Hamadaea sp.]|nr:MFS transporter [Hamadaea sp.]